MAGENTFGANFSIDVTKLKAGLAQANRLIKESESEFRAAAAGMDDWSKSEEGLTAKQKSLNDIIGVQQKKVDALQSEYDRLVSNGMNPASAEAVKLRTQINNENTALNKNKTELSKVSQSLKELQDNSKKGKKETKDLGDSAKEAGDGFTVTKGAIANFIGNGLTKLVEACSNAISAIAGLADSTREYREDMAKLDSAFAASGHSAEDAQSTYDTLYKILGESDQSVEAAQQIALLANNTEDVSRWAGIAAGVVGTFSDALQPETFFESANETLKLGEATGAYVQMLEGTGHDVDEFNAGLAACTTEAEKQAYMLQFTEDILGDAADKYNELTSSQQEARAAAAKLEKAQADMGAKIEPITTAVTNGFAKLLEKALELTDNVDFGALADKVSGAFDVISDGIDWAIDRFAEFGDFAEDVIGMILEKFPALGEIDFAAMGEGIKGAFENFTGVVLPKIADGIQWLLDNLPTIGVLLGGIGAAFIAFQSGAIAIKAIEIATKAYTAVQAALNAVMSANPIGLIIIAITALVAAFVYLWNNCEGFRNFWIGLWDTVKSAAITAWEAIKNFFTVTIPEIINNIVQWFSELPSKIGTFFAEILTKVIVWGANMIQTGQQKISEFVNTVVTFISQLPGKIWTWLLSAAQKVVAWGSDLAAKGLAAATQLFTSIVDKVAELPSEMLSIGKNIVEGIWEGINGAVDWLIGKIEGFCSDALGAIKSFFKIKSPSRVMRDEIGKNIDLGMAQGITKYAKYVTKSTNKLVQSVKRSFTKGLEIHSPSKWAVRVGQFVVEGLDDGLSDASKVLKKNVLEELPTYTAESLSKVEKVFSRYSLASRIKEDWQQVKDTIKDTISTIGDASVGYGGLIDKIDHTDIDVDKAKEEYEDYIKENGLAGAADVLIKNGITKDTDEFWDIIADTTNNRVKDYDALNRNPVTAEQLKSYYKLGEKFEKWVDSEFLPALHNFGNWLLGKKDSTTVDSNGFSSTSGKFASAAGAIAGTTIGRNIIVNQTNNYKQAYDSRYERYKSKKSLAGIIREVTA